jgi:hypothetical protein
MQPVTPENTTQKVGKIYFRLFALIYKGFKYFRPFKCRKQNVEIEMEIDFAFRNTEQN